MERSARNPLLTPDRIALLVILLCWLIGISIVGVGGDFPLNDDWSYARGVYSWVEEGRLQLHTWPAMTLIAQLGVGALYCEIFGFSFEVLRWSTLVSSLLCVLIFYLLLRKVTEVRVALFAALVLHVNALFFSLSFTFMTEVHFLFPLLAACLFFSRYLEARDTISLLLATLFSVYAVLVRQPGILVPLAFGFVLLLQAKTVGRKFIALLPFLVSFGVLKYYYAWLRVYQPQVHKVGGAGELLTSLANKTFSSIQDIGVSLTLLVTLFVLPMTLLLLPSIKLDRVKKSLPGFALGIGLLLFLLIYGRFFPTGNVIYNLGLGPKLLQGVTMYPNNVYPIIGTVLWDARYYLALASACGVLLLLLISLPFSRSLFRKTGTAHPVLSIKWAMALLGMGYFVLVMIMSMFFDRYALTLLPCLLVIMIPARVRFKTVFSVLAVAALVINAGFSVGATHDYLSWNRARKEAYDHLRGAGGVPAAYIDAGFEWNAWQIAPLDRFSSPVEDSWWFTHEDDFVIAFDHLDGYEKLGVIPFSTLLPPGTDSLLMLQADRVVELDYAAFPLGTNLELLDRDPLNYQSTDSLVVFGGGNLRSTEHARSGNYAINLNPDHPYGLTAHFWGFLPGDTISVSAWRYPAGADAGIVIGSDYQNVTFELATTGMETDSAGWERVVAQTIVKPYNGIERISTYVWNLGGETVWWDDIAVMRKKKK